MTAVLRLSTVLLSLAGILFPSLMKAEERFEFSNYREVEAFYERIGYTRESWLTGKREVPRLLATNVPHRWREKTSKEVSTATKKRLFFRALAPIILRSNELILEERVRLKALQAAETFAEVDRAFLTFLAEKYRLAEPGRTVDFRATIPALLARVDVVPASLALAQAAEESGWGTSRFADVGNALFGQWTWGEGIRPAQQRGGKGDYRIAAFDSPLDSISAYMLNLNSHPAYDAFRSLRTSLRSRSDLLTGHELAGTLSSYSERGGAYVESLRTIIRVNKLEGADEARLAEGPTIYLVPVGEGSE